MRRLATLLVEASKAWMDNKAMRLSAAVAMYAVLSLSPLLIITIKIVSSLLDEDSAARQVRRQVEALLGPLGAQAVESMIIQTSQPGSGLWATTVSFGLLVVTASFVFLELQDSLNTIWRVKAMPAQSWASWIRSRVLSLAMVFVIGFLLLVSQAVTTMLTFVSERVTGGSRSATLLVDTGVSLLFIALLFGLLFRVLPDVKISWRDVLLGAVTTAILFKIGQYVLALYFRYAAPASAYGAAGSFVAVLLWVYYSCWILLFGAELTKVYSRHRGRWIEPEEHAAPMTCEDRQREGL